MIVENGHISPKDPRALICTKFGTASLIADLITYDNFLAIDLGVLILWGSNFAIFISPGCRR